MIWKEIVVNTDTESSDIVADAFFSIGCQGVKIIDKNDILDVMHSDITWDYIDEKCLADASDTVKVSGFVAEDRLEESLAELKDHLKHCMTVKEITVLDADDESWYDNWKRYYSPIHAGNYVIVPKWIKYDNTDGKTVVLIDPGMAFGTGEHESTKLCLTLMSEIDIKNKSVIDVGTGSGILGIAAIKSGAKSCSMYDIDSVAVKAAKENSILNGVDGEVLIEKADLLEKNVAGADVVLANLTADILIRLSVGLKRFVGNGGKIICSGIIHVRKDEVIKTFASHGFKMIKELSMGEWDGVMFGD